LKRYFNCVESQNPTSPSPFVPDADETKIGAPKKQQAPRIIISAGTGPEQIPVSEVRDGSQLTFWTAILAFGESIPPLFVSKSKPFEKKIGDAGNSDMKDTIAQSQMLRKL
jgi:hypothetical protein